MDSVVGMANSLCSKVYQSRGLRGSFTFFQAILFQAVNPKLWAITLAASAGFGIGLAPHYEALRLFAVFTGINLGVCLFWTTIGHLLSVYLRSEKVWRFSVTVMATFMASTVFLIFS